MDKEKFLFIDIGTEDLKTLIGVSQSKTITLTPHSSFQSGGFKNGKFDNVEEFENKLEELLKSEFFNNFTNVVLCLGGLDIHSVKIAEDIIVDTVIKAQDFEKIINNYLVSEKISDYDYLNLYNPRFFIDNIEVFNNPLLEKGNKLRVEGILFLINSKMNQVISNIRIKYGAKNFFAIPNALVSYEIFKKYEYFENTAIIDIGAGTTDICLIKDNKFHKGFSLNVGGDYITNDIMQNLELDFTHAENLKKYFGKIDNKIKGQGVVINCSKDENPKNIHYDFIYELVDCRVNDITEFIKNSVEQQFKGVLNNIFLLGDSVLLYNFEEKLKVSFNLPMKCGNIKELPNISVNLDILGLDYIIKTEENIVNVDEHKVVIKSLQDENIGLFAKVNSFFKM